MWDESLRTPSRSSKSWSSGCSEKDPWPPRGGLAEPCPDSLESSPIVASGEEPPIAATAEFLPAIPRFGGRGGVAPRLGIATEAERPPPDIAMPDRPAIALAPPAAAAAPPPGIAELLPARDALAAPPPEEPLFSPVWSFCPSSKGAARSAADESSHALTSVLRRDFCADDYEPPLEETPLIVEPRFPSAPCASGNKDGELAKLLSFASFCSRSSSSAILLTRSLASWYRSPCLRAWSTFPSTRCDTAAAHACNRPRAA